MVINGNIQTYKLQIKILNNQIENEYNNGSGNDKS